MRPLLLFLLSLSAFAQVPTVTITGSDTISHSVVGITFSTNIQPLTIRLRYIASPGTCTSGTGGFVQTTLANGSGEISPRFIRMNATGLAPSTQYQFCPEATTDGTNWSSGVGSTFTTLPLPAVHPALPIPPATFKSDYPNTGGYTAVTENSSCSSFQTDLNTAVNNLMANGSIISIPAGSVCAGPFTVPEFPDLIHFSPSSVSTTNNTIGVTTNGYPEGQGIVFSYNNYTGTLPAGIVDGYLYYVHIVDANDFQLYYGGTYANGGTLVALTSQGSGSPRFALWPRPLKYIIIRTATPDAQFTPEHVRTGPQWVSQMATLKLPIANVGGGNSNIVFATSIDQNVETTAGNIRFVGIEFTTDSNNEASNNPLPWESFIRTYQTDSNIVWDRCYFHAQPFPNRILRPFFFFDGMDIAIKDSYWDNFDYWHGALNGMAGNLTGNHTFTIAPGSIYYGTSNPGILASALNVTISGTPNGASAPVEGAVYYDMSGNLTVGTPAGVTATANQTIINTTVPNGNGSCNYTDIVFPVDAKNRQAAGPVACFGVTPTGTLTNIEAGDPYHTAEASEGATSIAGTGPGPFQLSNNYISGTGIVIHFDDSGGARIRGDYLVQRNRWHSPMEHMYGGPVSNGYWYGHRQPLEWKGGQRIQVDGNIFDGSWREVVPSAIFVDVSPRSGGYSTDVDLTNNTFQHGPGVSETITAYDNYPPYIAKPGLRYRFLNNLAWDINGWTYSAYSPGNNSGNGWDFESGESMEDAIIDHNTFFDNRGRVPYWFGWDGYPGEGISVTSNFLFYTYDNSGAVGIANNYSPGCSGKDETYMDCAWTRGIQATNYRFQNNVIIPSWTNSLTVSGQVSQDVITSAFPNLYATNPVLSSSLGGVPQTIASVGWFNPSIVGNAPNFRLQSGSAFISSGQHPAADGRDVGANIDALEAAQGKVILIDAPASSITSTSAAIAFIAPDSTGCPVDYSSTDPNVIAGFTRVADSGGTRARSISLTGLTGGTTYYYRVNCAVQQPLGKFRTN